MSQEMPIDHLREWIGTQERACDAITPELLKRFRATLSHIAPLPAHHLPLGIHWCLAAAAVTGDMLGVDGHTAKGGFLPPIPLPRRMWASSRLNFHQLPDLGQSIHRTSTITDVTLKHSKTSGPLIFVHIDHCYAQQETGAVETLLLQDSQTIVYRQSSSFKKPAPEKPTTARKSVKVVPTTALLFRYSALTFNGHRIHYDDDYATLTEGYPGLVVQGPLMATLLMNMAQSARPNCPLRSFEFRGVAPAFVDQALRLSIEDSESTQDADTDSLEIRNHEGALIMSATAGFGGTYDL